MEIDDLLLRRFVMDCYEDLILERLNTKLKAFSEGLDAELDRLEEEGKDGDE